MSFPSVRSLRVSTHTPSWQPSSSPPSQALRTPFFRGKTGVETFRFVGPQSKAACCLCDWVTLLPTRKPTISGSGARDRRRNEFEKSSDPAEERHQRDSTEALSTYPALDPWKGPLSWRALHLVLSSGGTIG
jgi:hypothetical protein